MGGAEEEGEPVEEFLAVGRGRKLPQRGQNRRAVGLEFGGQALHFEFRPPLFQD